MLRYLALFTLITVTVQADDSRPSEAATAAEVDRLLLKHLSAESVTPAPLTTDEDFLRRVSLDLTGNLPTPAQVTTFGLNPQKDKRAKVIDSLLSSPEFGELWASYWKDVIYLRATEARSRFSQGAFEKWLEDQLNANRPWDEVARELITATGDVRKDGQTGLIFAHSGSPEELAAEISRIFLGIQISCANCHNHPTDSWKREQFHELAAYLPRIQVRPDRSQEKRTFLVSSFEEKERGGRNKNFDPDRIFKFMDRDGNGQLSKTEARGPLAKRFDKLVSNFDINKDGQLSQEELVNARDKANTRPGRGNREYYMPDLENPSSRGTLISPDFFIKEAKGPYLELKSDDQTRRNALADLVTSPSNPWFARAYVNRIWSEMLGVGFYMPIDDMGPQRIATDADVLEVLSKGFLASGYDVKWLFCTIALTQAYQRQLVATPEEEMASSRFASAISTRLRADQIYNSIDSVLEISKNTQYGKRNRGMRKRRAGGKGLNKANFSALFGFDPSTPQVDILGNVPQALFMMNSQQLDQQIRATGETQLARILRNQSNDENALDELYLLVLSRNPSAEEITINLNYIQEVKNRQEAFEDIMWSLINSAEFLSRR